MSKRRIRTSSKYVFYALQYIFRFIASKNIAKDISIYHREPRIHLELDLALQTKEDISNQLQTSSFIIDETLKVENEYYHVWLWVAMEPTDKTILGIRTLIERNILVTERFIQSLVGEYGKTAYHNRWRDMVSWSMHIHNTRSHCIHHVKRVWFEGRWSI